MYCYFLYRQNDYFVYKGGDVLRTSLYDYCLEHGEEALLRQWHPAKNGLLTPRNLSHGSKQKVWWLCDKGHAWQAVVYMRTGSSTGCPYCAGKRAWPGENDLASQMPEVAAQWHPVKNQPLTPAEVPLGSHKKVWWLCEKGHAWQAMVKARTSGSGCPACANRQLIPGENDLATTHPQLARQWHPAKNGALTPENVGAGTRRKVWWRCEKGHQWQASVLARAGGTGCPVCTGKTVLPGENDLASRFPAVAAQWHTALNGGLAPEHVTVSSNRRVWWRCDLGHVYQAGVASRTVNGSGCPYCAGRKVLPGFNDLATLEPEAAAQWHPVLNGTLTPEQVTVGSHRKVWWECPDGHIWKAVIYSRAGPKKCGCPVCAGRGKFQRMERYAAVMSEARP